MKELQFPLVRITVFFILGILFPNYLPFSPFFFIALLLLLLLVVFFTHIRYHKTKTSAPLFGSSVLIFSLMLGAVTQVIHTETYYTQHFTKKLDVSKKHTIVLTVIEKLKSTGPNNRYTSEISRLDTKTSCGKIILAIKKDSFSQPLFSGTKLKLQTYIYPIKKTNNPNQFDYCGYLANKQIYGQVYCSLEALKKSTTTDTNLRYYADRLRNKIACNLEKKGFKKEALSVVMALLLGQQQDITSDVIQEYQYAGAVHILSVSGLHVAFILLFITFLLKPLPNTKKGRLFKLLLLLVSLWGFGVLAGLAPPVLRSVTMFSLVAIGQFLKRSVNIYHTLLVSALVILLIQPGYLFDVGFQLSYLALFFIVWLHPILRAIWKPKHKITNYFWDIITVSFAAQIGTLPLSLFYFHQFPSLFFVTNLIVLPALSFLLGLGVIVVVLAVFDCTWEPPIRALEWGIGLLNKTIQYIASFEDFVWKDIAFNSNMMWSCYGLICAVFIWYKKPNFDRAIIGMLSLVVFQISCIHLKYSNQKKNEFIVFHQRKNTLIATRTGDQITLYGHGDATQTIGSEKITKPYLIANLCRLKSEKKLSNFYYFKQKKIVVITQSGHYLPTQKADIIVLTQSPKLNLERLFKSWKPKIVIADASNYKSYVSLWRQTCEKEKIPFHDTSEKGFFKL